MGVAAAAASAADTVCAEARRQYVGIPDGVMAKITPFDAWEVVDAMTQVVAGTHNHDLCPSYTEMGMCRGACIAIGDMHSDLVARVLRLRGEEACPQQGSNRGLVT